LCSSSVFSASSCLVWVRGRVKVRARVTARVRARVRARARARARVRASARGSGVGFERVELPRRRRDKQRRRALQG